MKENNGIESVDNLLTGSTEPVESIAEWYHVNTKLFPGSEPAPFGKNAEEIPEQKALQIEIAEKEEFIAKHGKKYATSTTISLPEPTSLTAISLQKAMQSRRSAAEFNTKAFLSLEDFSAILNAGYGINNARREGEGIRRYIPSAGGLFPLEIYLLPLRIEQVSAGDLCHYQSRTHALEIVGSCKARETAVSCLTQSEMADAAAILVISGLLPRVDWKYGERGYRYILLEAGHVVQNICLAGAALGLGVCPVAGYHDDVIHDLLWLDGVSEFVVYVVCIGNVLKESV